MSAVGREERGPVTAEVVVIIPAHNAASTLPQQLAALDKQRGAPDFDVVVVDNRSSDGTGDLARAHGVRVIEAPDRGGVHYARNVGAGATNQRVILHCDADDVVDEGWLAAMTEQIQHFDIVGGALSFDRVNSQDDVVGLSPPAARQLPTCMGRRYAVGANMGYRRTVWEAVGGFDESFVGGHEEVDFAWRAQSEGFSVGFAPQAVVFYRQRGTLVSLFRQRFSYGSSFAQLYSKHSHERITRVSPRTEARKVLTHFGRGPKVLVRRDTRRTWLMHTAWVLGRLRGDLRYKVRAPG
ncbi:glycosyltransferase [Ornithinimicrobium sp. Y1847]|uniref:glycosyltransferase n=1 Tax=Ornithinimicrobium sp. Y1847 TaxID=3405419 RepID=UPI003B675FDE